MSILTTGLNLELKARCPSLRVVRCLARSLGASSAGVVQQTDTYFASKRGRLKLRENDAAQSELIFYMRADKPEIRRSSYLRCPVVDAASVKSALGSALGVVATVRKRRELLLWHNVRIHLDEVENLGNFIELEAIIGSEADQTTSGERLERLVREFKVQPADRLRGSYAELIRLRTPI